MATEFYILYQQRLQGLMYCQVWVHEQADGKLDIVDGKQRITSLLSYLDGIFPRNQQRFALEASQHLDILSHTHLKFPQTLTTDDSQATVRRACYASVSL